MGKGKKYNPNSAEFVFKRLYGVKPDTFEKMLAILQKEHDKTHRLSGAPPKLTVKDKLTVTLKYLREYRTMESIGADYNVRKSTICESIQWVENTLTKDKTFKPPGKKVLKKASDDIEYIIIDVTESPIQRPKKGQKEYYSGKKNAIQ
ncbi:MAG: transposase family protein [Treponema sp.]|nr:transposase family protein [Treponema sp.]